MKVKRCPKDCQFDWARFHSDLDVAVAHLVNEMESLPSETTRKRQMTIEPMTQEEFLEYHGGQCPVCRRMVDPQKGDRKVCSSCGAQWHIRYAPKRMLGYVLALTIREYGV